MVVLKFVHILILLLIQFLGIHSQNVNISVQSVPKEGDLCSDTIPCPKHDGLECQSEFCRCEFGRALQSGECLIRPGIGCDPHSKRWNNVCVHNAACSVNTYKCECGSGYFANGNGTCSSETNYGDACLSDEDCSSRNKSLKCIENICQCDAGVSQYRANRVDRWRVSHGEGCVPLVNQPCGVWVDLCIENAECEGPSGGKICKCHSTAVPTSQNTCEGVNGGNCPCAKGFVCLAGSCRCSLGQAFQTYDPNTKSCFSFVGSPCNDGSGLHCVGTAICRVADDEDSLGICECPFGSLESIAGGCELGFGTYCNASDQTRDMRNNLGEVDLHSNGKRCDSLAGLYCKNGLCSCGDGTVYDEDLRKCLIPPGFRCKGSGHFGWDNKEPPSCVQNAKCVKKNDLLSGRCECEDGFIRNVKSNFCEESTSQVDDLFTSVN